VPDLHPVIEQTPAALAAYYDLSTKDNKLDPAGYPDYKEKAIEWAAKGNGKSEDGVLCYAPLVIYIRNTGDVSGIPPQILENIKKDAPVLWNIISKSIKS
jgi:hypothetical protein